MVSGVWQIFRADCTVILRYCKSKSDKKSRSYLTLKHSRILNLQFLEFFKGLKRGLLTKIRCSQWLQGMVLDGLKGFQAKKSKSMTFNYKSCISYLVLAQRCQRSRIRLRHKSEEQSQILSMQYVKSKSQNSTAAYLFFLLVPEPVSLSLKKSLVKFIMVIHCRACTRQRNHIDPILSSNSYIASCELLEVVKRKNVQSKVKILSFFHLDVECTFQ